MSRPTTERRQLEEQLQHAQRLESIGRLAGGIAHDFNNLLQVVSGYADALAASFAAGSQQLADLRAIEEAAAYGGRLTSQLLTFARRQRTTPEVLDLKRALDAIEDMVARTIGTHISLGTDVDHGSTAGLALVRIDPGQFEQLVMNMAVNARDAMRSGGTLTISVAATGDVDAARASGLKPNECVHLAFTDTGHGMEAEVAARVFDPFFTTKPEGEGTGLGLAMCYGIVGEANGRIWVESMPGKGTTFHMLFPRVDGGEQMPLVPARQVTAPAGAPAGRGGRRILVVEDQPQIQTLVRRILEASGHTVLVAADGPGAVRIAAEESDAIDLLISDVLLPGLTGDRVAAEIRVARPEISVLFISGFNEQAEHRIEEIPGARLLLKPFALPDLEAAVAALLDGRTAADAG